MGVCVEMSNLTKMTLKEATPLINNLYESFGVKSVILLKDNEWTNIVTVIHLTRRKVEDLNNEYRFLEERLGKIDDDSFKIIFQARPISEFNRVVMELEKGCLKIGEMQTKLLIRDPEKTFDQKISDASYVVRLGEYAEYNCYSVTLRMEDIPDRILSISGISASILGLRDFSDLARSWLGLNDLNSSINVYIIIPIYAIVSGIQYQGGNEIEAKLKIDQRLFNDSSILLTRKGEGERTPILERTKYDVASLDNVPQNGFFYVSLQHDFSAIGLHDLIAVNILHNELGLLNQRELSVYPVASENPCLKTFALFDAGKEMEEHLLNPNDDEDFAASVYWLLEGLDIRCLKLRRGRSEVIRENKTEKGSADIIAYDSKYRKLIVIDCTIAVPQAGKIDKIKSTADYISRKITYPVKAAIFTAKKAVAMKETANKCEVKLIDNTDLERLIEFYKKGHDYPAKKMILDVP
jgi:hypothetical protein